MCLCVAGSDDGSDYAAQASKRIIYSILQQHLHGGHLRYVMLLAGGVTQTTADAAAVGSVSLLRSCGQVYVPLVIGGGSGPAVALVRRSNSLTGRAVNTDESAGEQRYG